MYRPAQWTSILDVPSGYIKNDGALPEGPVIYDPPLVGGGKSGGSFRNSSGRGSALIAILSVVLVLALPAILFNLTNIFTVLAAI